MCALSVDASLLADLAIFSIVVMTVLGAGRLHKVSAGLGRLLGGE
jgi:hypothetical protein